MPDEKSGIEWLKRRLYSRNDPPKPRARRKLREAAYDVPEEWADADTIDSAEKERGENHMGAGVASSGQGVAREPGLFKAGDIEQNMKRQRLAAEEEKEAPPRYAEPVADSVQVERSSSFASGRVMPPQSDSHPSGYSTGSSPSYSQGNTSSMIRTIFLGSLAFFLVSLGIAAYMFFAGSNEVSAENIDIEITGPLAIPGGEELVLQIGVVNRNSVPIKLTDLIIEYPDGTRSAADTAIDLPRYRESLGTIASGERVKSTIRAVLFGTEGTEKNINVTVEYRIDGSNAIFFREKAYTVKLSSSPVTISVESLSETTSGQEINFAVKLHSNANEVMENILVRASYPFGFDVRTTDPAPTFAEDSWQLGDLAPGGEREIRIRGVLVGDNTDERVFKFEVGTQSAENPEEIAASFETVEVPVSIRRPFLALSLSLDGRSSNEEVIVTPGERVTGRMTWANNLDAPIHDVELVVSLDGTAYDRSTISAPGGFYRSQDNTIVWNRETMSSLALLEPGDRGEAEFSFDTTAPDSNASQRNATISIVANVKGRRLSETQVPETLESAVEGVVKLQTGVNLASRAVYTVGPFENIGPIPPRVEAETTYTIIWNVANTANDATDVRVSAPLPSYVEWLGNISPANAPLAFEPVSRQLIWNIGDVPAGTGFELPGKQVMFQISFEPSLSQVQTSPDIVGVQHLSGLDSFTGSMIQTTRDAVSTNISTDPNAPRSSGIILP